MFSLYIVYYHLFVAHGSLIVSMHNVLCVYLANIRPALDQ